MMTMAESESSASVLPIDSSGIVHRRNDSLDFFDAMEVTYCNRRKSRQQPPPLLNRRRRQFPVQRIMNLHEMGF
jgi:hypothetical protein